jgi:hypothetical protein
VIALMRMPIVFMPMDASGKIRTQDMLKLTL